MIANLFLTNCIQRIHSTIFRGIYYYVLFHSVYERLVNTSVKLVHVIMGLEDKKKKILAEKYFAFWKVFVLDRRRKHSLESKTKILDNKLSKFVNNLCISEINNIPTYSKHQRFTPCYDDNVQKDNRHYKGEIFENRLIAQKQMIVQQKALISEQVRVINELKSKQEVRIVVDSFVEEVEHVNHIKANKVHKVLLKPGDHPLIKRMKEREEDRKYHRALFEMKKKEREKYIAEKLIEDEKQRKLLEAESKRQKAREKREGERRLKEEEVRKRADKEYCRKLAAAAEVLRDRLTVHRAMSLWKEQVDRSKESMKRRLKMLKKVIVQTHFRLWRASVVIVRTSVTHAASNLGNLILVRNCWRIWALVSLLSTNFYLLYLHYIRTG